MEGAQAAVPQVGAIAQRDVPRCRLSETVGAVRDRVQAAGWDICVVVNEAQVILGLLRQQGLSADPNATAEQVMRPGPVTYRPSSVAADVVERMQKKGVGGVLITRSDGTLIGWLRREDAERVLREQE
jgi:predicted transcriptional regulator